jgi:hypothetical protein
MPEPARVKHLSVAPLLGKLPVINTNIRLGRKDLPGTKHSSLLKVLIHYDLKKFYNIGPWMISAVNVFPEKD